MILFFSITGVYLVSFNTMDVFVMLIVAMAAIALRLANFPLAPLLLGFILGGINGRELTPRINDFRRRIEFPMGAPYYPYLYCFGRIGTGKSTNRKADSKV